MKYESQIDSPQGVKKYTKYLMARLERGEITEKRAMALNKLAYTLLHCIQEERKALEIDKIEQLKEQLDKLGG